MFNYEKHKLSIKKFQAIKMSAIKNISLYIPHVFPNFTKEYVAAAFESYGIVDRVDFVAKQDRNGRDYNAVYVHFIEWHDTRDNRNFQAGLLGDSESDTRVYHDNQWYWIVLPNTAKKHSSGERKPRIDLGDAKSISYSNIAPTLSGTPVKQAPTEKVCPGAPQKRSYAAVTLNSEPSEFTIAKQALNTEFDAEFEAELMKFAEEVEDEAQMDEIEEMLEAEDQNLVRIDGRYVQELEAENWGMRAEIAQLRAALINLDQMFQAEAAKVRAFSGAYGAVNVIEPEN